METAEVFLDMQLKKLAAHACLEYLNTRKKEICFLGIGTGSTVNYFIEELKSQSSIARGYISSSQDTTKLLEHAGLPVVSLSQVKSLKFYIDGADEIDHNGCMIKGGGGALTQEKIIAEIAEEYLCIATEKKEVKTLGTFPVPVEVIFSAIAMITEKLTSLFFGKIFVRVRILEDGAIYLTDNGHPIIDVYGLSIDDPEYLEKLMNNWPGVVTVGIFSCRRADHAFLGSQKGIIYRKYSVNSLTA